MDRDEQLLRTATDRFERRLAEEIGKVRVEIAGQLGGLRADTTAQIGGLRAEIIERNHELLKWALIFWVTNIGAMAALFALFR